MKILGRSFVNLVIGVMTCVLVVALSTTPSRSASPIPSIDMAPMQQSDASSGASNWLAQGMMNPAMKQYRVTLSSQNVKPNAPTTMASGMAEAMLKGDRLMVRGQFKNLSSALRDYAVDPVNPPNPKITSAVHIHQGEATNNGPFQFALTVKMNRMGMGGQFQGEYALSPEQLQALADGKLYIDLHTKQNRAGELRGAFQAM